MSRKELPRAGLVQAALAGRISNREGAAAGAVAGTASAAVPVSAARSHVFSGISRARRPAPA